MRRPLKTVIAAAAVCGAVLAACGGKSPAAPTKPVTPAVTPPTPPAVTSPTISSFKGEPTSVSPGQVVTLSWTVLNATRVTIDNSIGEVPLVGSRQVSPTATTTYHMTATGSDASTAQAAVTVTVQGVATAAPIISAFYADSPCLATGGTSALSWEVLGETTQITIDNGIGEVRRAGSVVIAENHGWYEATFTLTAYNGGAFATNQVKLYSTRGDDFTYCAYGVAKASVLTVQRFGTPDIVHDSYPDVALPWRRIGYDWVPHLDPLGPHYLSATSASSAGCIKVQMFRSGILWKQAEACGPNATATISDP